jgi:uncharacterized protein
VSTFLDSSAVVKLYADEADHERIRSLSVRVVSQLARVEVPAAIWRKQRMAELTPAEAGLLVAAFEADYFGAFGEAPRFIAVAASTEVLDMAARYTGTHGLRAYDAVQLATARMTAMADPECRTFAAFDKQLRTAAAAEGFDLVP